MRNGIIIVISSVLVIATSCTSNGLAPGMLAGHRAPDFSLQSSNGDQVALSKLEGKVVVLDFWATWCEPCQQALPHLQSISANDDLAQRGLVVLAVDEEEKPDTVRPFIEGKHFTFTVVQDAGGSVGRDYSLAGLPTTIVVGRDGVVQAVISGWAQDTASRIDEAVAHALDAPIR